MSGGVGAGRPDPDPWRGPANLACVGGAGRPWRGLRAAPLARARPASPGGLGVGLRTGSERGGGPAAAGLWRALRPRGSAGRGSGKVRAGDGRVRARRARVPSGPVLARGGVPDPPRGVTG